MIIQIWALSTCIVSRRRKYYDWDLIFYLQGPAHLSIFNNKNKVVSHCLFELLFYCKFLKVVLRDSLLLFNSIKLESKLTIFAVIKSLSFISKVHACECLSSWHIFIQEIERTIIWSSNSNANTNQSFLRPPSVTKSMEYGLLPDCEFVMHLEVQ